MVELPALFDAHVHFRQDDLLQFTVPQTARYCEIALAMPNLLPDGITTQAEADAHAAAINKFAPKLKVLKTLKLTRKLTPEEVSNSKDIAGVKIYPEGVTTNSSDGYGTGDFEQRNKQLYDTLDAISRRDIPLLVHAEMPGAFVMNREREFLYVVRDWLKFFPSLRVVIEHISTRDAVEFVGQFSPRCAGSIAVHHMMLTLDDIIGDKLRPHYFCKPIPKTDVDRRAVLLAALSGKTCFFMGSDSAPHTIHTKLCDHGCAGVFNSPRLVELLTEIFADHNKLDQLPYFASINGRSWYNLPTTAAWNIQLEEKEDTIPLACGPFVPYMAGRKLKYTML